MCSGVDVFRCGCVQVWMFSGVDVCRCGCVQVRKCSGVGLCRFGMCEGRRGLGVGGMWGWCLGTSRKDGFRVFGLGDIF